MDSDVILPTKFFYEKFSHIINLEGICFNIKRVLNSSRIFWEDVWVFRALMEYVEVNALILNLVLPFDFFVQIYAQKLYLCKIWVIFLFVSFINLGNISSVRSFVFNMDLYKVIHEYDLKITYSYYAMDYLVQASKNLNTSG